MADSEITINDQTESGTTANVDSKSLTGVGDKTVHRQVAVIGSPSTFGRTAEVNANSEILVKHTDLLSVSQSGAQATTTGFQTATYGHSTAFLLMASNTSRKELIVLNHGNGSFHLYYRTTTPTNGTFVTPVELFFHDTYVEDRYTGAVYGQWHVPEEQVETAVAVTFEDTNDIVRRTSHGLLAHDEVSFPTVVTTTGITVDKIYYIVNGSVTADTFTISATRNGSATPLTTNGSGTMKHSIPLTGFVNVTEVYT